MDRIYIKPFQIYDEVVKKYTDPLKVAKLFETAALITKKVRV